jgi:hypothetical protein
MGNRVFLWETEFSYGKQSSLTGKEFSYGKNFSYGKQISLMANIDILWE